ncbi:hypothetical protein DIPPA_24098 [Diplonema papillatum]|nr:hypothetical protein DIPPA_24098 [Diplonema papillatum]
MTPGTKDGLRPSSLAGGTGRPPGNVRGGENTAFDRLLREVEATVSASGLEVEKGRKPNNASGAAAAVNFALSPTREELLRYPKEAVVDRLIEVQEAAVANYSIAEDAKARLFLVNDEVLKIKERQQSVTALQKGLADQSRFILQVQEERTSFEKAYRQSKAVVKQQEEVIARMETVARDTAKKHAKPAAAANDAEDLQRTVAALRMKIAALQRKDKNTTAEVIQPAIRSPESNLHLLRLELGKLSSSLRPPLPEPSATESAEDLSQTVAAISKRYNTERSDWEQKHRSLEREVDDLRSQLQRPEGMNPRMETLLREYETSKVRIQVLEASANERERKAGQDIASLKLQLMEAKAYAMAIKPPSPAPPVSNSPAIPASAARPTNIKIKKLDPIVPRHRFQDPVR